MSNHIAKNIMTKGFINSNPLTDGILSKMVDEYTIYRRKTGSGGYDTIYGFGYKKFREDLKRLKPGEIDAINVKVNYALTYN